jgi:hypothetical protein
VNTELKKTERMREEIIRKAESKDRINKDENEYEL